MNQTDEPPPGLPEERPVPIEPEDVARLRDAPHAAVCAWREHMCTLSAFG